MRCEIFEGLAALRRDSRIGPAARGCFEWLWHQTAGRADYIVVTTKRIAYGFLRRRTLFELRMADVDWAGNRLVIPSERMKSGRAHVIHLNETAKQHLLWIRTDRELVFEWPHSMRQFQREFHKLQSMAGIPEREHFGLHGVRRTVATLLWQYSPEAARLSLGHAGVDVTIGHYVQADAIVANALDKLPQPKAFAVAKP